MAAQADDLIAHLQMGSQQPQFTALVAPHPLSESPRPRLRSQPPTAGFASRYPSRPWSSTAGVAAPLGSTSIACLRPALQLHF